MVENMQPAETFIGALVAGSGMDFLIPEEAKIREFMRKNLVRQDLAHDIGHIECVVRLAKHIAMAEGANLRVVVPAAWFHGPAAKKAGKSGSHGERSAEKARRFLRTLSFSKNEVEAITRAITESSADSPAGSVRAGSLEGRVVRDADLLDAMGARGIARVFTYTGSLRIPGGIGCVEWDIDNPPRIPPPKGKQEQSAIGQFFSHLLWVKDRLSTGTARSLAQERHAFMVEFLRRFKAECDAQA